MKKESQSWKEYPNDENKILAMKKKSQRWGKESQKWNEYPNDEKEILATKRKPRHEKENCRNGKQNPNVRAWKKRNYCPSDEEYGFVPEIKLGTIDEVVHDFNGNDIQEELLEGYWKCWTMD